MLCTLLQEPFSDPDYLFEIKWDGYRIIASKSEGRGVKLLSRRGLDFTRKYPPVRDAMEALPHDIVCDGEVIVPDAEGRPDFDALQRFNGQANGVVFYYVFDLLWIDGRNVMDLPLEGRKRLLEDVVVGQDVIRYSEHFDDGQELFRQAKAMRLEGVVAKRRSSRYLPGHRGKDWFKIPTAIRQEFVIGGWVESERRIFRTLLFGAYKGGDLHWIGHAGGGYRVREMKDILKKLQDLEIGKSPFVNTVDYEGTVHWVRPALVASIKYATTTRAGRIRKPAIFLGFRDDMRPGDVVAEGAGAPHADSGVARLPEASPASNWHAVDEVSGKDEDTLDVEGVSVKVYDVRRELWNGITKAHLLRYYHAMAGYILPYTVGRPLSLYLKLKGPYAPGLYIKDMEGRQPAFAEVFTTTRKHRKAGKRDVIDYLVCNNTATILYIINLGCVDINPWNSTVQAPTTPDYIVVDLDPSDGDFSKAVQTARAAKQFFDENRLKAFPKTSGKTGMHLYLPCSGYTFQEARRIAGHLCAGIHGLVPDITTLEVSVAGRADRLYIDASQNDYADTVAAPYSVRPYKHPCVSAPLTWREVRPGLDPEAFHINAMEKRVQAKGDLFARVLDRKLANYNSRMLKQFL